jgi:hypothetical protein
MKYTFFWNGPFSNWHSAPFEYKGQHFANSEQAFMWEKALCFNDFETAEQILHTTNPKDAKKLGRQVKNFDNNTWALYRFEVMFEVCFAKFDQNPALKDILMENENFVEASPYDTIWGIGMAEHEDGIEDPKNWKGENLLGKVLDLVKEELKINKIDNKIKKL